jgi:hypothetical protein
MLPCHQRNQSALTKGNSGRSACLLTAIRQSEVANDRVASAGTNVDSETFFFSRALMLSHSPCCKDVVWRYAFWLSYRATLHSDPMLLTIVSNQHYASDYHFAPGHLSNRLVQKLQAAYKRSGNHHTVGDLANWFKIGIAEANCWRELYGVTSLQVSP